jgi:hypothetical protein
MVTIEFYNRSDINTFPYETFKLCADLKLTSFVEVIFSKTLSSDTVVTRPLHSLYCFVRDKPLQIRK